MARPTAARDVPLGQHLVDQAAPLIPTVQHDGIHAGIVTHRVKVKVRTPLNEGQV